MACLKREYYVTCGALKCAHTETQQERHWISTSPKLLTYLDIRAGRSQTTYDDEIYDDICRGIVELVEHEDYGHFIDTKNAEVLDVPPELSVNDVHPVTDEQQWTTVLQRAEEVLARRQRIR